MIDVPSGSARIRLAVDGEGEWEAVIDDGAIELQPASDREPDALLSADWATWEEIARDVRGGMVAFREGRLSVRQNLHLGVGFLAATSAIADERRLRFESVRTRLGKISTLSAGEGDPVICVHGLGGTKASFLPTVAALADRHRVIAMDLPGFGDSDKPLGAAYDAPYFARAIEALLDELGIERAHLIGNSMGGRVAIEGAAATRAHRAGGSARPGARLPASSPLALAASGTAPPARPDPARTAGHHRADRPQPGSGGQGRLVCRRRG